MASLAPRNPTQLLLFLLPVLFQLLFQFSKLNFSIHEFIDRLNVPFQIQNDTFDFIVVGAGPTGSVLANRLSEHNKVLLLEAGGVGGLYTILPVASEFLFGKIEEDWKYKTVPQKWSSFGFTDNKMNWPSGKGLGGSSLINGVLYTRGSVQGFDTLANKTRDSVWKMENALKYYRRIENYGGFYEDGSHGKSGSMHVEKSYTSPYVDKFEQAMHEFGYKTLDPNPNGPSREGFSRMELYTKYGRRWSAYDGYIKPIQNQRSTLVVRQYSYVEKVLFDQEHSNRAVGVQYLRHGKLSTAYAKLEVILSAGSIQSPKILMLSGIGPKDHLESIQIPVRLNLPVGAHLQDKYGSFIGPFTVARGQAATFESMATITNFLKWATQGTGIWSTPLVPAYYTIRSNISRQESSSNAGPDLTVYVMTAPLHKKTNELAYHGALGFKKEVVRTYLDPHSGRDVFFLLVNFGKSVGTGTLTLKDANPSSDVLIDPRYFEHDRDLAVVVEGIKFSVNIVENSKSLQSIDARLVENAFPGCEGMLFKSDEYWKCLARHATCSAYKWCGTAPIGQSVEDKQAVVDSRLRVFGARNLRVVDASVLSEKYVSVNVATCLMMGELASDFILQEYAAKPKKTAEIQIGNGTVFNNQVVKKNLTNLLLPVL